MSNDGKYVVILYCSDIGNMKWKYDGFRMKKKDCGTMKN